MRRSNSLYELRSVSSRGAKMWLPLVMCHFRLSLAARKAGAKMRGEELLYFLSRPRVQRCGSRPHRSRLAQVSRPQCSWFLAPKAALTHEFCQKRSQQSFGINDIAKKRSQNEAKKPKYWPGAQSVSRLESVRELKRDRLKSGTKPRAKPSEARRSAETEWGVGSFGNPGGLAFVVRIPVLARADLRPRGRR